MKNRIRRERRNMKRVVHFEIGAQDPERASKFYSTVFGWKIQKWTDNHQEYWLVTTGSLDEPGIIGGIFHRVERVPRPERIQEANAYICTMDVENLDESIAKVNANGGEVVTEKLEIPGTGYLAYANDTEGNIFGMMESSPDAPTSKIDLEKS